MNLRAPLISVLCAFLAMPAHSNCSSLQSVKVHGEKHFASIDDGPETVGGSIHKSKFKLPEAKNCFLYRSSPSLSSFNCTWFVAQGFASKAKAVREYEALVEAVRRCVSRPETLERFPAPTKQGERASLLDTFPGIKPTQQRAIELSYGYSNFWWSLEFEYEVNDDVGR